MNSKPAARAGLLLIGLAALSPARGEEVRDLRFFLHRLRTLDHLPELEDAHTAMSSTWDRTGGNNDGVDFKRLEGTRNVLLDIAGPGCIHRIFTGKVWKAVAGTRIQIILDEAETPVFDLPVNEFLDDHGGPFPYPLVFHKTYPGMLFPIPFEKHCRVQLVNEQSRNWGNYWQVTYTRYAPSTKVRSLTWPLNADEKEELAEVCAAWLRAERSPPTEPEKWSVRWGSTVEAGKTAKLPVTGRGVIRQLRIKTDPLSQEALRGVNLQIRWDGRKNPSVDVPLGDLFGTGAASRTPAGRFHSLLIGATEDEAYCCIPMPYESGFVMQFENRLNTAFKLEVRLAIDSLKRMPPDWGRFHATWRQHRPAEADSPRWGAQNIPAHLVLDQAGPGKYIGVLLQIDWPWESWWGEGDWLIWTDEADWPPSYHGTGSEEYFNAGWCEFDRKAVSGYITEHPGWAAVYSFHLNDAFQFQKNIRVAEETVGFGEADRIIHERHPMWASTAYWYAPPRDQP